MSKKQNPRGNCRRCGHLCRGKHRICHRCKRVLHQVAHDLDLLKRFPDIIQEFDEEDMYNEGLN